MRRKTAEPISLKRPPSPLRSLKWRNNPAAFAADCLSFPLDPAQSQLLLSAPRRCILNCTRQWGKSTVTAIKAVHQALFQPGSLILVLSPSERQSAEFIHKAKHFLSLSGMQTRGDGKNHISLLLHNQSRIIGLPSREGTIRGFSNVALLLIDEAARVPDELYHSVRPMLAVSGGSLWLISTPAGRRGFFYDTWSSGDPEWTRLAVPATECPRIPSRFLDSERATLSEHSFRQEYLCEFHDSEGQLVRHDVIRRALSNHVEPLLLSPVPLRLHSTAAPPPGSGACSLPDVLESRSLYIGVDFGKCNDYTALAILEKSRWQTGERNRYDYERRRETRLSIRYLERFPLGTTYTDITAAIGRIVRSLDRSVRQTLIVDATGVGNAVTDIIRKEYLDCRLYPVTITAGGKQSSDGRGWHVPKRDLLMSLVVQLESGRIRIAENLPLALTLASELEALGVRVTSAGNEVIAPGRSSQHDDLVFAAALANWRAIEDK